RGPTRLEPGHRATHAGACAGDARPALLEGPGSRGRAAPARGGTADLRSARLRGGGRPRPGKGSGRAPRRRPALRGATAPGAAVVARLYARPRRRRRARAGGPGEPARLARPVAGSTRRAGGGGGARPGAGPRWSARSAVARAAVHLATGELASARSALERVRQADAHGDPRASGETLLVTADLHLAAGDPRASEAAAVEALGLFGAARDRGGECRSRVRRVHALLALGRSGEAVGEGRRAVRTAPTSRSDLLALSHIALGRALLRNRSGEARVVFERALACADGRPVFEHAARLGRALC